jgi:hypothetical protein
LCEGGKKNREKKKFDERRKLLETRTKEKRVLLFFVFIFFFTMTKGPRAAKTRDPDRESGSEEKREHARVRGGQQKNETKGNNGATGCLHEE